MASMQINRSFLSLEHTLNRSFTGYCASPKLNFGAASFRGGALGSTHFNTLKSSSNLTAFRRRDFVGCSPSAPPMDVRCDVGPSSRVFRTGAASSTVPLAAADPNPASTVSVMVNDCSGKMGHAVAEAAVEAGLRLVPLALTGHGLGSKVACGGVAVDVRGAEEKEEVMARALAEYPDLIVVDFTLPAAVNGNAEFYCKKGVPFVMGTTGGDRKKLMEDVLKAGNYAVIAPQMGKQVVAFQAAMEIMADTFPGAFSGYQLKVTESHQSTKVDTSGTAKAVVESFQKLGLQFDVEDIEKVRDADQQINRMGVPESFIGGHAFHTYQVVSQDNTVAFEFQHNVCGRSIYAQGTVDAVLFLAKKIAEKQEKKVYNMIDVLKEGNMR